MERAHRNPVGGSGRIGRALHSTRAGAVATLAAAMLVVALVLAPAAPVAARSTAAVAEISVAELPSEARDALARIRAGGPFRYERDGVVFGNRERLLPERKRGYYHEYTVPTPGAKNRGARRIVCGGPKDAPEACWYSADHYQSFARIRE